MQEMVREAKWELIHYPERNPGYYVKKAIKRLAGKPVEPRIIIWNIKILRKRWKYVMF